MSQTKTYTNADEAMAAVAERVRELALRVRAAGVSDEDVWFRNLLLGILNSAQLDYQYTQIGVKQRSPYLAAWSCRNLLELRVITKYVLESAVNAEDFKNDFVIDAKEFYEAISAHSRAVHSKLLSRWPEMTELCEGPMKEAMEQGYQEEVKKGPQNATTDSEAAAYKQLLMEFGISNTRPKRSSDIARIVQQEAEFSPLFKVCSKIMHKTALSIAASVMRGSLDEVTALLSNAAACDLMTIDELVRAHFDSKGVQPPR
jgi:hypothetical protein